MGSHEGRDLQAEQDLHEATQLLIYRGREGWEGYWRVLNAVREREKEREGEFSTFQDHHQFSFGHQFLFKTTPDIGEI